MERTFRRTYRLFIAATLLTVFCFAQIQQDKYYHFGAGAFSEYVGKKFDVKVPIASSFVIGFGKEIYDYVDYGKFDTQDLAATVLGGVAYTITIKLINTNKNEKINNRIVRSYRKHKRKQSRKKRKK